MKPSEQCKKAGLKSLAELSRISGESVQTLINWHNAQPRRFELILDGVMFERAMPETADSTSHLKGDL